MTQLLIGDVAMLGWNSAKRLQCEENAGEDVRLEAFGDYWLVVRDKKGRAHSIDFGDRAELARFWARVND